MKIKRFTDEDIQFLKDNYMTMTHAEMAEKLGRTKGTISTKLSELKLIKRKESPWTDDQVSFLVNNYENMLYSDISKILGRTESNIRAKCFDLNLVKKDFWTDEEIQFLKTVYYDFSNPEIAEMMGRTQNSVHIKGSKLGLKKSPYYCDYDFFHNIDTEEKAYWLGFIYADGWVNENEVSHSGVVGIELSIKDYNHLKKFNKSLSGNYRITTRWRPCLISNYNTITEMCCVRIFSRKMMKDLESIGVTRDKTYTMTLPKIPDNLFKHFVRGYFDGDGSIYFHNNRVNCCFCSVSKIFLEELRTKLYENGINSYIHLSKPAKDQFVDCYRLQIAGHGFTQKYLHWIYDDANIYLDRKYKRYLSSLKNNNHEGLASQK